MSEFLDTDREILPEGEIAQIFRNAHRDFLDKVPNYRADVWNPIDAIREGTGSCMAELLYVVGHLVDRGVSVEDISIGFVDRHGEEQGTGFVGGSSKKYAHTTLYVSSVGPGDVLSTMMVDFRASAANDMGVSKMSLREYGDEYLLDGYTIHPLEEAIQAYGFDTQSDKLPTVDNLVDLARGKYRPDLVDSNHVRFDEDF